MNERRANVYENKGPVWKTPNKAGTLQKTKDLVRLSGNLIESKGS